MSATYIFHLKLEFPVTEDMKTQFIVNLQSFNKPFFVLQELLS